MLIECIGDVRIVVNVGVPQYNNDIAAGDPKHRSPVRYKEM